MQMGEREREILDHVGNSRQHEHDCQSEIWTSVFRFAREYIPGIHTAFRFSQKIKKKKREKEGTEEREKGENCKKFSDAMYALPRAFLRNESVYVYRYRYDSAAFERGGERNGYRKRSYANLGGAENPRKK